MTDFEHLLHCLGEACRTCFLRVQFSKVPLALLISIFLYVAVRGFLFRLALRFLFQVSFVSPWFSFYDAINMHWGRLESDIKKCFVAVSLSLSCLAKLLAFSRVRFISSWSFSKSSQFCNPMTILFSSFSAPKLQYFARPYKSVIKLSTDSPTHWLLELNFAHSKMIFLFTTK